MRSYLIKKINLVMLAVNDSLALEVKQRNQAMNYLLETYPKAFDLCNRRPLKSSILDDIFEQKLEQQPDKNAIEQAFIYYSNWGSYLCALTTGAQCFDLDGKVCGEVNRAQELKAKLQLDMAEKKLSS